MNAAQPPRALFRPQGTCPRKWVAEANGVSLFDRRGAVKRYSSEAAAMKAAVAAARATLPT